MIRRLELTNVRIFEGTGWNFELRPLTVFCGQNSAGKSTLLKIPLLLDQTQTQAQGLDGRLYLAGSRVDFGNYYTFISHGATDKPFEISITTDLPLSARAIEFLRQPKKSKKKSESKQAENVIKPAELRCAFTFSQAKSKPTATASKTAEQAADCNSGAVLDAAIFRITAESQELLAWKVLRSVRKDKESDQYNIQLPVDYFIKAGGFRFMEAEQEGEYVRFAAILDGILPYSIVGKAKKSGAHDGIKDTDGPAEEIQAPLPPLIQQALWSLQGALSTSSYLGPLRSPAKRYYVAHLEAADDLDAAGEFLPYVLRDKGDERVVNIPPGGRGQIQRQTLRQALDGWVRYLRTGESVSIADSGGEVLLKTTNQVLVQISIKSPSGSEGHALADSGFGYSQVLPILLRGLLTDEGSTFIVEQPELHLNPSLQVRLAEFFVSMVRVGKQVLVETHSEHLVNTMRVLAAEDESGELSEKSRIYFIDTSRPRPTLHELSVQKDGTVPDWPHYFFGEAVELTGRLLRAQQRYRTLARGGK
jgi:predicted ATPase